MPEYELHTLLNGIRVAHKQITHTKVVHCGFILDIGSRDERPEQQGLAHFWEHMAFKGTKKRKAYHILNRLEAVGGELNAYTTKEKICFYASLLDRHFESALELLTDITFDSIFPEKQIERERSVILEEMAMYYDSPEDAIQDDFDQVVFGEHPLGRNILGSRESISAFGRPDFQQFLAENMNTDKLVFCCVGNLPMKKVIKLAKKHLSDVPAMQGQGYRLPFKMYLPQQKTVQRPLTQAQCAIGRTAFPVRDKRSLPFFMLTNLLGGTGHELPPQPSAARKARFGLFCRCRVPIVYRYRFFCYLLRYRAETASPSDWLRDERAQNFAGEVSGNDATTPHERTVDGPTCHEQRK